MLIICLKYSNNFPSDRPTRRREIKVVRDYSIYSNQQSLKADIQCDLKVDILYPDTECPRFMWLLGHVYDILTAFNVLQFNHIIITSNYYVQYSNDVFNYWVIYNHKLEVYSNVFEFHFNAWFNSVNHHHVTITTKWWVGCVKFQCTISGNSKGPGLDFKAGPSNSGIFL